MQITEKQVQNLTKQLTTSAFVALLSTTPPLTQKERNELAEAVVQAGDAFNANLRRALSEREALVLA